ncbi:hypothetical protein E2C01_093824 [Portunus trituberculatus]|uniref:Uncharacterized protein n=1 Tax=Portunus trituberculatus TaxID=210409 RepID=A0A5B7JVI4_PORTR|nr:hypothetical protein [Portunus trituberculatus]
MPSVIQGLCAVLKDDKPRSIPTQSPTDPLTRSAVEEHSEAWQGPRPLCASYCASNLPAESGCHGRSQSQGVEVRPRSVSTIRMAVKLAKLYYRQSPESKRRHSSG